MAMRAVVPNEGQQPPCVVYWTGRVKLHVGVITWCDKERDASNGVLQVPETVRVCEACAVQIARGEYPKPRR